MELVLQKDFVEMLSKVERDLERAMDNIEHAVKIKKKSVHSLLQKHEVSKAEVASIDTANERSVSRGRT